MPDTFDLLRERTQGMRAHRDPAAWSSIAVEMRGDPRETARSFGDARIDSTLFRNLTGGQPTCFLVEPGEHTVAIQLSRWFRLWKYRRSSTLSMQVAVEPGETVKLVCGVRRGAKEEWRNIRVARIRPNFVFLAGCILAIYLGARATPTVRNVLARAMVQFNIIEDDVPVYHRALGLRANVVAFTFFVWCLVGNRLILVPNRRLADGLAYRFRYPYYLKKDNGPTQS